MLLRVQNKEGRGPFQPGITTIWSMDKDNYGPPIQKDFSEPVFQEINKAHRQGLHIGVAVDGIEQLGMWFNQEELHTLHLLGFEVCEVINCKELARTDWQVLITSRHHLSALKPISNTKDVNA